MSNKLFQYVAEEIRGKYNLTLAEAKQIVLDSFLPELYNECADFVEHYDAEYWAYEIMDSISTH